MSDTRRDFEESKIVEIVLRLDYTRYHTLDSGDPLIRYINKGTWGRFSHDVGDFILYLANGSMKPLKAAIRFLPEEAIRELRVLRANAPSWYNSAESTVKTYFRK